MIERWISRERARDGGGPDVANFAVVLVHGPGWDASRPIREQRGWNEHADFMDGLVADGFILLGGPVDDGTQTLHVVEAGDEITVRARLAEDPWAGHRLLEIGSVRPWALWLDFRDAQGATRADPQP
jgi:uncharacterized protein